MRGYAKLSALLVLGAQPAFATETISYSYDVLGRLTAVSHSGSVNNGVQTGISYDAADNRVNYAVSGAASSMALQGTSSLMQAQAGSAAAGDPSGDTNSQPQ